LSGAGVGGDAADAEREDGGQMPGRGEEWEFGGTEEEAKRDVIWEEAGA
jgi:hypothetical protein